MSTQEFITEVHENYKEDIDNVVELLKLLRGLQKEEQEVYEISVSSNL